MSRAVAFPLSFLNSAVSSLKGGLIGLAAVTVGLTNDAAQHLEVSSFRRSLVIRALLFLDVLYSFKTSFCFSDWDKGFNL